METHDLFVKTMLNTSTENKNTKSPEYLKALKFSKSQNNIQKNCDNKNINEI